MQFRLDENHYIDDRYLEAGTVIGDDTPYPFRYLKDTPVKDETGKPQVIKSGTAQIPSRAMTPLDDEAKKMYDKAFPGAVKLDRDPTVPVPVMGSTKQTNFIPANGPPKAKPDIPVGSPLTKD